MDKQITLQSTNPKLSQALATLQKLYDVDAREKTKKGIKRTAPQLNSATNFRLEYSNPYFSGPSEISVKQGTESKLTVNFHPKDAGSYSCRITAVSVMDVRIFEIEGVASAKSKVQNVEFSVAARQIVTQNIPIHNPSTKDWKFKVSITGKYFAGPTEFLAPASKTSTYPLVFKPHFQGNFSGTLTLTNYPTCEFIYNLRGIAEKPLAEDNIVVECQAKTKTSIFLVVKNLTSSAHPVEYSVQTDIPYVSGSPAIYVPPSDSVKYELSINPQCSGVFNGAIIFTSSDGNFCWYTVEVKASKPPPEKTIEVKAVARLPVAIEITMHNPLEDSIDLECTYEGKGLFADDSFTLAAKETASYKLMFYPFTPGTQEGSVMFFHETLGEFWYQLKLIAQPPNAINVPLITCEVGKKKTYQVAIENPTEETFALQTSNTNSQNFSTNPKNITLAPWSRNEFQIVYFPSSLDKNENSTLTLSHPNAGEWVYNLQGRGLKPTSGDVTSVFSSVGETTSCFVTFVNPFGASAIISTSMIVDDKSQSAFQFSDKEVEGKCCYHRTQFLEVAPFPEYQIQFSFTPKSMQNENDCVIEVKKKDDGLSWRFPVKGKLAYRCNKLGIPEYTYKEPITSISCKARTREQKVIPVAIPGMQVEQGQEDQFSYELRVIDGPFKIAAQRALEFNHAKTTIYKGDVSLAFEAIFTPLRAMKTEAELKIIKANGGRWMFKILIEAQEADVDDTIVILAAPTKSAGVSFQVRNQLDYPTPFIAFFTEGTPQELTVTPKSGIMDSSQSSNPGVSFKVAFSPSTFHSDAVEGKLVIQTEEMEWSYKISGMHPSQYKKASSTTSIASL